VSQLRQDDLVERELERGERRAAELPTLRLAYLLREVTNQDAGVGRRQTSASAQPGA
jgi:hypothetical protein